MTKTVISSVAWGTRSLRGAAYRKLVPEGWSA